MLIKSTWLGYWIVSILSKQWPLTPYLEKREPRHGEIEDLPRIPVFERPFIPFYLASSEIPKPFFENMGE